MESEDTVIVRFLADDKISEKIKKINEEISKLDKVASPFKRYSDEDFLKVDSRTYQRIKEILSDSKEIFNLFERLDKGKNPELVQGIKEDIIEVTKAFRSLQEEMGRLEGYKQDKDFNGNVEEYKTAQNQLEDFEASLEKFNEKYSKSEVEFSTRFNELDNILVENGINVDNIISSSLEKSETTSIDEAIYREVISNVMKGIGGGNGQNTLNLFDDALPDEYLKGQGLLKQLQSIKEAFDIIKEVLAFDSKNFKNPLEGFDYTKSMSPDSENVSALLNLLTGNTISDSLVNLPAYKSMAPGILNNQIDRLEKEKELFYNYNKGVELPEDVSKALEELDKEIDRLYKLKDAFDSESNKENPALFAKVGLDYIDRIKGHSLDYSSIFPDGTTSYDYKDLSPNQLEEDGLTNDIAVLFLNKIKESVGDDAETIAKIVPEIMDIVMYGIIDTIHTHISSTGKRRPLDDYKTPLEQKIGVDPYGEETYDNERGRLKSSEGTDSNAKVDGINIYTDNAYITPKNLPSTEKGLAVKGWDMFGDRQYQDPFNISPNIKRGTVLVDEERMNMGRQKPGQYRGSNHQQDVDIIKLIDRINKNIDTVRIAIYKAKKSFDYVFGLRGKDINSGTGSSSYIDDLRKNGGEIHNDSNRTYLKNGKQVSLDATGVVSNTNSVKDKDEFINNLLNGEKISWDDSLPISFEEIERTLKTRREKLASLTNFAGSNATNEIEKIDNLLTIFQDLFSKGDPTRFQQAFSEVQRKNPALNAQEILKILSSSSSTNISAWDALQSLRDSEGMLGGDTTGVMSQVLGQLSDGERDAIFKEAFGTSEKSIDLATKVSHGLHNYNNDFNVEYLKSLRNIPDLEKGEIAFAHFATELSKRRVDLEKMANSSSWTSKLYGSNEGARDILGQPLSDDLIEKSKELKENTKTIESPLNRAQSSLSKFAWQFDRATYSATQLNGVVTKLFAIVGSGSAVNDMITASSLRQTNQIMLASRRGMDEAQKLYDRIQMLVVKLPGNDTFLTNILTMLGTMDESLTAEDLEYMGGIIADYYMGAQAKGQFNNETERELRNYLMTGQTRNLTNSIIASEVESLKNLNSVKERTMALEKALQTTGMDSIAHYKSYHNTLEEFKGRFQKSFADLGDLYLGFLQGLMEVYNFLDSISGSFLSQLTISLGVFALGALGLTVVLAQVTQTLAGTVDAMKHLRDAVETGKGLEGEYGEAIRKTIAWILFKIGLINEETAKKVINTDATLRNTISEKLNSLSIRENIGSMVASTIAWFGNTKQKVVARLETYKNILATKLETLNLWIENREVRKNTMEWARNTKEKAKNRLAGYGDRIKGFLGGKLGVESTWGSIFGDVFGRGVNMLFRIGGAIARFLATPLGEIVAIVGIIITLVALAVRYVGQLFGWWSSFGEMFQAFGDGIRRTWEAFVNSEPIQYMITTFQNFAYTLEGVFNLIRDIGGSIWEMVFGVDKGGNKVFDIVGAFLEVIGAIGNFAFMTSPIRIILDIINAIGSAIAWVLDTWNEFIDSAEFQGLLKDFQEIRGIIGEAWSTLTEAFNEVRDAFMSVFEDDDEMKEMVENTNILLEVLKAVAMFLRVTVVPVVKLIAYIIKGIADVIKFIVDIGIGVVDFFTGGALTNDVSSLPIQKQLAQSYSNRVNNTQTIINNNFASGSVLTDARNMTAKEVMKLFTSAFGFNKSRGVNGVLS